ncbi:MAG: transketolase [Oscillospiraceae bacterium]|nr:transketolase [Oscillospiraceae bacterium]
MSTDLKALCRELRADTVECIGSIGRGHLGGCLSAIELLAVLYFEEMNIDPKNPKMEGRDRFICSKGHAGPAVYATLSKRGYFDRSLLYTLNQGGTTLPSHCDMLRTPGVDMTAGSLGQGFSCAAGAALASKLEGDGATIYTLIGDGESQEGQIWEAAMFAAAKKLDNLIGFTDYNKYQLDAGVAEVCDVAPLADKWKAFGWNCIEVADGNDPFAVKQAVEQAKANRGGGKPTMVILNTVKGCGVSFIAEMGALNHHVDLSKDDMRRALDEIKGGAN